MHSWLIIKKPRDHENKEKYKNSMDSMHSWLKKKSPREQRKKKLYELHVLMVIKKN
jgi:hypothetical protein